MANLGLAQIFNGGPVDADWYNTVAETLQVHEDRIGEQFVPYVPSWFANSTPPAIGNGVLDGGSLQMVNGLALVEFSLVAGTTTTFGTGFWSFDSPLAPTVGSAGRAVAIGQCIDASSGLSHPIVGRWYFGGLVCNAASGTSVSATVPFTWTNGDELRLTITFQGAT